MPLFKSDSKKVPRSLLADRFHWPPFSVLNTMTSDWQSRKSEWNNVIHTSTLGRDTKRYNATPTNLFGARESNTVRANSISSFDPFLAELMYRWFSVDGAKILDPFAGGCVRGEVAAILGRHYTGIDLSVDQVVVNAQQYQDLLQEYPNLEGSAVWNIGDSAEILPKFENESFDMILTCPPYYNLEQYTTDSRDLSRAKTYEEFFSSYLYILQQSVAKLKDDSFCVVVVSEVRNSHNDVEHSDYVGLVPDTVLILKNLCGLKYYNEIILENNIGSLPVRAPKNFEKSRKIGRHHQNVLVFYKGNITHIEKKFGIIK